ncbi:MAG: PfkB family carbohydrate kinase [Myxococcota bacterium]
MGGSATYASLAVSPYTTASLVGVVGKDFGSQPLELLRSQNIDLQGLTVEDGKTFFWDGEYNSTFTSRTTHRTDLNVFADFYPHIPESLVHTPYVLLGNIDPELQIAVLEQLKTPQFTVADTMNFWIERKKPALESMLRRVDVFILNEEEARQLTGVYALAKVAKQLLSLGPSIVIIKQGEYGAMLFHSEYTYSVPALPLETMQDPTGAGDSFAGGFLGYLAKQQDTSPSSLRQAMVFATASASLCVEGVGTQGLFDTNLARLKERCIQIESLCRLH